ncbi:MAG TPA: glycosyltransferase family 4 protein [Bacteroidota bacterium]|nr:glycosyltransferase family 4 protein [Bacteroidota bacterium]
MVTRSMPSHSRGGVQDHTHELARGLSGRGHTVTILTTAHPDGKTEETYESVRILFLTGTRPSQLDRNWWKASTHAVRELTQREHFDILHSQGPAGYAAIRMLRRPQGISTLISFHGTHFDELVTRWKRGFSTNPVRSARNIAAIGIVLKKFYLWDKRTLPIADAFIATSNEQQILLEEIYRLPHEKIFKVFNGMDLSRFSPGDPPDLLRSRLGIPSGSSIVLCMARLIRDKGIQHMINAVPEILETVPHCHLIVVGDGNHRPYLERHAGALGIADHVTFTGSVEFSFLPEYFRLCDIFVNPTVQQNGYDLTMLEAMACEKPVISSNIGSTPTLIAHDRDGILFPPANEHALADAVIRLLRDRDRRHLLGRQAREKVMQDFTLDIMVERTIDAYRTLAERKRR